MKLDKFLDVFLGELIENQQGIDSVKATLKANMYASFKEYDDTKVEFQVLTDDNNYNCDISMILEGYDDGEVIFVDCRIDDIIKPIDEYIIGIDFARKDDE